LGRLLALRRPALLGLGRDIGRGLAGGALPPGGAVLGASRGVVPALCRAVAPLRRDGRLLGAGEMLARVALRTLAGPLPVGPWPLPATRLRCFRNIRVGALELAAHRQRAPDQPLDVAQL